jgi:hypothetical protein
MIIRGLMQYVLQFVFHEAYAYEIARFARAAKVAVGFAIIQKKCLWDPAQSTFTQEPELLWARVAKHRNTLP